MLAMSDRLLLRRDGVDFESSSLSSGLLLSSGQHCELSCLCDGHVWQSPIFAKSVGLHSLRRGIVLHVDGLDGVSGFVFGGV